MCWWFFKKPAAKPLKPVEYQMTGDQVAALCMGAKDHVYIWDSMYYVLSMEGWKKVFADVLANMPKYLAEKLDCEDMAFLCMTRIIEKYEINGCGVAVGNAPIGYHGFNLFVSFDDGKATLHTLEPQTGEMDLANYNMDTVIFS